MSDKFAH